MSHPEILPPPRMKDCNGGLLSKATELSLEAVKTAGEGVSTPINLSSRGPGGAMMAPPTPPERRLQWESLRQVQAGPFLSIAFFLEVQTSQSCQAFDESLLNANVREEGQDKNTWEKKDHRGSKDNLGTVVSILGKLWCYCEPLNSNSMLFKNKQNKTSWN